MSRLNMTFDDTEDKMIKALKKKFGMKQTTELIRFVLTREYNINVTE